MQINIYLDKDGRFQINKSDDMGVFMAIGMMELAKQILLEPPKEIEEDKDIEGQISIEDVNNEVQ